MITKSEYVIANPQADGRVWCKEAHLLGDGRTVTVEYLAQPNHDFDLTLQLRAANINADLARKLAAEQEANNFVISWTKREFLERFTFQERIAIREARKTDPIVDDFMDFLDKSQDVTPGFGTLLSGLGYLELIGVLAEGRAAEIGGA